MSEKTKMIWNGHAWVSAAKAPVRKEGDAPTPEELANHHAGQMSRQVEATLKGQAGELADVAAPQGEDDDDNDGELDDETEGESDDDEDDKPQSKKPKASKPALKRKK